MSPETLEACTGSLPSRAQIFAPYITAAMDEFGIDTPTRQAAFLAQIGHESGGLRWLFELWGPTPQQRRYEPPSDLAVELGNTEAGDGYLYRGRGLIQVTGRSNYRRTGSALGMDLEGHPELLGEPMLASRSAACFWQSHALNELADVGDFEQITRKINGGTNGLEERVSLWQEAKQALGLA